MPVATGDTIRLQKKKEIHGTKEDFLISGIFHLLVLSPFINYPHPYSIA